MPESITCAVCGVTNWGPNDRGERICGYCNWRVTDRLPALHIVDVEVDEWSSIPPRLRPIERPRP